MFFKNKNRVKNDLSVIFIYLFILSKIGISFKKEGALPPLKATTCEKIFRKTKSKQHIIFK